MKFTTVLWLMLLAVMVVYAFVHYTTTGQMVFSVVSGWNQELDKMIITNGTGG
jgi:hypothetical protein